MDDVQEPADSSPGGLRGKLSYRSFAGAAVRNIHWRNASCHAGGSATNPTNSKKRSRQDPGRPTITITRGRKDVVWI
jgi:hypothetical protein